MNRLQALVWAPRVLGILFAIFVSVFALDVFSAGYGFGETIVALFMHLIPTVIVVIALVVAWRWAGMGAIAFIALALLYFLSSGGQSWILTVPMVVIGVLFALSGHYGRQQTTP